MAKKIMAAKTFRVPIDGNSTQYIDLALLYSAANHRIMHQNYVFRAKFSCDGELPLAGDEAFSITVLPTTWPLIAAYKQARDMYVRAMSPEMETAKKARWHSYRVLFDTAHKTQDAAGTKLLPSGCSLDFTNPAGNADYVYSEVLDDTGTNTYTFHMIGASDMAGTTRSFGAVAEFDAQNDTSTDEAGLTTNYDEILNDVNAANETNLHEDGDRPPYNKDNIQIPTIVEYIHSTQTLQHVTDRFSTPVMDVPFGLVKVVNHVAAQRTIQITLSPGNVKGIAAEVI